MLEIGAGTSAYVARFLPPAAESVFYVAADVSREALRRGAHALPEGEFVRCAADAVPLRAGSFHAVLSLGVLHHIPRWRESLLAWVRLLVPGGWLVFHEAIEKPRILGRFRDRSFTAADDSPHEGNVELAELRQTLEAHGRLLELRTGMTPLRVLAAWSLSGAMKRSRATARSPAR